MISAAEGSKSKGAKGSEELIHEVHSLCHHIAMVPIDFLLVGLASWR